jgi:hypothetical protein
MRQSWSLIAIVLVLPLGGCVAEQQQQQLASCKLEAARAYPNEPANIRGDEKVEDYMETCMEAHGYEFSESATTCIADISAYKRDAPCYVPTSWFARLIYRLETGNWD